MANDSDGRPDDPQVIVARVTSIMGKLAYDGAVADGGEMIPGVTGSGNLPGLCALYLICFTQPEKCARHSVLFAVDRRAPLFDERAAGSTHQVVYAELDPAFEHTRYLTDLQLMKSFDPNGRALFMGFQFPSDQMCARVCRELFEDVCDGTLRAQATSEEDRAAFQREWGESAIHYLKKHSGRVVEVTYDEESGGGQ